MKWIPTLLHLLPLGMLLFLGTLLPGVPASAQLPPDSLFSRFEPNADFILEVGGEALEAEIFFCQKAASYLLAPAEGDWMLLSAQTQKIHRVDPAKAARRDSGRVDVFSGAVTGELAPYDMMGQLVFWTMPDGQEVKLRPRPWMLGDQTVDEMAGNPAYAYKAGQYEPAVADVEALRGTTGDVRVKVYFGSWCPHCKEIIPRVLRLSQDLAESAVHFEYYGVPRPMTEDDEAAAAGIHTVPTAVVYVGGEEKGRLDGVELKEPEAALRGLLGGA